MKIIKALIKLFMNWILTPRRVVAIWLLITIAIGAIKYSHRKEPFNLGQFLEELYSSLNAEFLSVAITVFILDALNERQSTRQEQKMLFVQMGSPNNDLAKEAVRILRANGWLEDGSIQKVHRLYTNQLIKADLKEAELRDADLRGTNFLGSDFQGANMTNCRMDDYNTVITRANLALTTLDGAHFDQLWGIQTVFYKASLRKTSFRHARMERSIFVEVEAKGADFSDADIRGASFKDAILTEASFKHTNAAYAVFTTSVLWYANFQDAYLLGADFRGADLSRARLTNANLRDAKFDPSTRLPDGSYWKANSPDDLLIFTDPQNAHYWRGNDGTVNNWESKYHDQDLRNANFRKADLEHRNFRNSNLQNADFSYSKLKKAKFRNANLEGANFTGADLTEADLTDAKVGNIRLSDSTIFPDGSRSSKTRDIWEFSDRTRKDFWRVPLLYDILRATSFGTTIDWRNRDFRNCNLRGMHFNIGHILLEGANFTNADLQGACFSALYLNGVNFTNANLRHANLLAIFDESTIFPDGTYWKSSSNMWSYDQTERFTNPKHPEFWQSPIANLESIPNQNEPLAISMDVYKFASAQNRFMNEISYKLQQKEQEEHGKS